MMCVCPPAGKPPDAHTLPPQTADGGPPQPGNPHTEPLSQKARTRPFLQTDRQTRNLISTEILLPTALAHQGSRSLRRFTPGVDVVTVGGKPAAFLTLMAS